MRIDFKKEIEKITSQIIEKYQPEKIILFGSAAREEWDSDSDADFLIIKENVPFYGAERIRELSRLVERNIAVDLLVYKPEEFEKRLKMGDPFLKAILKEGKVLYGWLRNHLLLKICQAKDFTVEQLKEDCEYLTTFYVDTRYPVHWPTRFSPEEAQKAMESASRIKSWIRDKMR